VGCPPDDKGGHQQKEKNVKKGEKASKISNSVFFLGKIEGVNGRGWQGGGGRGGRRAKGGKTPCKKH